MDKVFITAIGSLSIIGIYWFFFGKKDDLPRAKKAWTIRVSGGYQPNVVTIPSGETSTLTFIREDPNSCLEEIVIPEARIKQYLPLHKKVTISLSPTKKGQLSLHCSMNMFHGVIHVL